MAQVHSVPACCGIRELSGLGETVFNGGPQAALRQIAAHAFDSRITGYDYIGVPQRSPGDRKWRFLIFSQAIRPMDIAPRRYGEQFAQFLTNQGVGSVVQTETKINPNSKNELTVWVWCVDWDALAKWYEGNKETQTPQPAVTTTAIPF